MKNLLVLMLFFMASSVYGEVYRWKDSAGVLHFSNSLDDVPARYQTKVKAMNYGGEERKGESPPAQAATVPPATSPEVEKPPQMSTAGSESAQKKTLPRRQSRRHGRSQVTDE